MAERIVSHIPMLLQRVEELEGFLDFADEVAGKVEDIISRLHTSWEGASAQAQKEFHDAWQEDHAVMLCDVNQLREALAVTVRNAQAVQRVHASMWPPVGG